MGVAQFFHPSIHAFLIAIAPVPLQTYLARKEGTESGKITWLFDVSDCGREIDKVFVRASFTTFEDGDAKMELKEDKEAGTVKILDGSKSTLFKQLFLD